jgi:hypothetical protein
VRSDANALTLSKKRDRGERHKDPERRLEGVSCRDGSGEERKGGDDKPKSIKVDGLCMPKAKDC